MGAGLIQIILTGLNFDVLLPITDITGRKAYFSLITSNSSTPVLRMVCTDVHTCPCLVQTVTKLQCLGLSWGMHVDWRL